jgi:hypothetical protein
MPIGADTTSRVRINPTIIKTIPRMAATNRPVRLRIKANKSQSATKGHKYQGVLLSAFSDMEFSLVDFFSYTYTSNTHFGRESCNIHGIYGIFTKLWGNRRVSVG